MKNKKKNQKKNKFFEHIKNKTKDNDYSLFDYYFNFVKPSDLAKKLFEIRDKKKNNDFVEGIKDKWSKLKDEIEEMSEEKIKSGKPDKILKIAEEILKFNKQNQSGTGFKILMPSQMLSRLPITLAQLKAGNNSEKLKNETTQLFHFHCHCHCHSHSHHDYDYYYYYYFYDYCYYSHYKNGNNFY